MCVSAAILPSLLSLEIKLSPVKRRANGEETSELLLRADNGEYFSKLSLDLDLGVGFSNPRHLKSLFFHQNK